MKAHVHLLTILQFVWGGIGLLLGVSTLFLALGSIAIGVASSSDQIAAGVTAAAFGVFAAALIVGGAANVWAGGALGRLQPLGRLAALTFAVLNLFILPFGTALAIYAYWVLLHNEARMMFEGPAPLVRD